MTPDSGTEYHTAIRPHAGRSRPHLSLREGSERGRQRLEAETHRNLEVIWLLRRLRPNFKTLADFRCENREAFRQVFRDFVKVCRSLELFGRELIAVDGTRIKAVNSRDRNFTGAKLRRDLAASQERLERYLQQMDEMDAADMADASPSKGRVRDLAQKIAALRERQARLETHRKALQESGEAQLSLPDPDARAMHSGTGVGVGYNVQIAVDTKHTLIAEQQVHSQVSDLGRLAETARAARTSLGVERIDAVADKGYFKVEAIGGCEAAGITPYVPKPRRSPARRSGRFPKRAVPLRRGNRHLRLSERAAAEAPVHQQGARHDVDARRQSRGLPGLRFEGAVHE